MQSTEKFAYSAKQREYIKGATRRWNIKSGATRSGKTFIDLAATIPLRVSRCEGSGLILLIGNTQGTVERNILTPMRARYTERMVSRIRQGDGSIRLFGKTAFVLGADAKSRVAALQGTGVEYCYGDEMTTWAEEVFWMLKSRLDGKRSLFDGTCNPEGPSHWLKKFIDSDADIYHQAYTIDDNPFLPEAFVRALKKEYAGTVYYDRYILGRWAQAEGAIYPMFDRARHIANEPPSIRRLYFAVDVGHANATVFLCVGIADDGRAYVLAEYAHEGRKAAGAKSPHAYAMDFMLFKARQTEAYPGALYCGVYVDPSALGFMTELRELGESRVYRAVNDVLPGIQTVASMIDSDRVRILSRCEWTLSELSGYVWDEAAAQRGVDAPRKENDHAMDALRYLLHTRRGEFMRGRGLPEGVHKTQRGSMEWGWM